MELYFLALLVILMIAALTAGFPVAFALPGSAIISVALAALAGYLFQNDVSAFFAQDGPIQWLTAGVTNQRSLYWNVERDTLIAIPLFIFMGIMLQRSKVAEDLLVAMAQLFGPIPGGLGISVVFVGALLAATTGIVGATVIAMGLISLPAMMRNNYSKPLATGTICASGTLGQIIPPSIVLIILADQLSRAASQANAARKELYKTMTGEFSMPSEFDVLSASAGDMFMGALIPGVILVGIYMLFILVVALIKPSLAPAVPHEGKYDRYFFANTILSLVPPLGLIFIVLGSILLGVATVNQAGAIGAVGAIIMAGYRLTSKGATRYLPAILAMLAIIVIALLRNRYDLNIKSISSPEQWVGIQMALVATAVLVVAILWSLWRTYRIENTLTEVMIETAKTSSMVFIILLGAAMLTTAFRAFGGEELVKHFLTGLPGGFWMQFFVVMAVIFVLGFFLDFIEIAVVVVPIVAPILLMSPEANVTAVWLGVMIGLNIQTSFLTPPFGFALFYLRGVADKAIKTLDIYKGAAIFIMLQLVGLGIAGAYPSLVNYLPSRTQLLSDTAPPPTNPRLQSCLEDYVFEQYADNGTVIKQAIGSAQALDLSTLPDSMADSLSESLAQAATVFDKVAEIQGAQAAYDDYAVKYRPLHRQVRQNQSQQHKLSEEINHLEKQKGELRYAETDKSAEIAEIDAHIEEIRAEVDSLAATIPAKWDAAAETYKIHRTDLVKARRGYVQTVDSSAEVVNDVVATIQARAALAEFADQWLTVDQLLLTAANDPEQFKADMKGVESALGEVAGSGDITSPLSKARRSLSKDQSPETLAEAQAKVAEAKAAFDNELAWREKAEQSVLPGLLHYVDATRSTIGLRAEPRLTNQQAKRTAACLSHHKDISLDF